MGLEMNSIHAPSAASSSDAVPPNEQNGSVKPLLELIKDRDNLEAELSALGSVLQSHNVDMNTPLVTPEGFPRSDIDVAQIRTTRARIIWLRNDYKSLMSKIEAGLHAHHAAQQGRSTSSSTSNTTPAASMSAATTSTFDSRPPALHAFNSSTLEPPFARVNSVVVGSPADSAGMRAGDEVRRFGTANWTNHERLTAVAQAVQRNEGRELLVRVKRKDEGGPGSQELELRLVPRRNWGGRGMLGCHLVPI